MFWHIFHRCQGLKNAQHASRQKMFLWDRSSSLNYKWLFLSIEYIAPLQMKLKFDIKIAFSEINTSCPKSYSERIWWTQITLGRTRIEDCPTGTVGNAKRYCHPKKSWQKADLSACTSLEFLFANTTVSFV